MIELCYTLNSKVLTNTIGNRAILRTRMSNLLTRANLVF